MLDSTKKWNGGEKVLTGRTSCVNHYKYQGLVGTVDFEFDTLVYVLVRAKGERKDRAIVFHRDELKAA